MTAIVPLNHDQTIRTRGKRILDFVKAIFGPRAAEVDERARRCVEESIEMGQAAGIPLTVILKTVIRVYEKPAGDLHQEMAQVGFTLESMAASLDFDLHAGIDAELVRLNEVPAEVWQARHKAKIAAGISAG